MLGSATFCGSKGKSINQKLSTPKSKNVKEMWNELGVVFFRANPGFGSKCNVYVVYACLGCIHLYMSASVY